MKSSKRLRDALAIYLRMYDPDLIAGIHLRAEAIAKARGGRQVTPQDWDKAVEGDEDSERAPVVTSGFIKPLGMLAGVV